MTKKIDEKLYEKYIQLRDARQMTETLDEPGYCDRIDFNKANEAVSYLKQYSKIINEFEKVAATEAVVMAIDYLTSFELELEKTMVEGIAKDERLAEIARKASVEARKVLDSKIEPAVETLISEIDKLGKIEGYSDLWLKRDFEAISDRVRKAAKLTDSPSVFLAR